MAKRPLTVSGLFVFCALLFRQGPNKMTTKQKPIGIYYEHPGWFRLLFAELDRRNAPYVRIEADRHQQN